VDAVAAFPSPDHTLTDGGHVEGEGTDFVVGEVTDTLRATTTEASLLRYSPPCFSSQAKIVDVVGRCCCYGAEQYTPMTTKIG
jgi:hypothetical protein